MHPLLDVGAAVYKSAGCMQGNTVLAERIEILLPKLIYLNQKGFINGRFIGQNTLLTFDN